MTVLLLVTVLSIIEIERLKTKWFIEVNKQSWMQNYMYQLQLTNCNCFTKFVDLILKPFVSIVKWDNHNLVLDKYGREKGALPSSIEH